ncbi:hypothetical protein FSP39_005151 [Pinctada imbricata]|uniref:Uncharacterized protein n=1 Tax=Pinctada imbricata TaxID=66713 RepID=A0AA88YQJ9_PINIB|nr:hypothetical protein FSP39_005151 [Pinctada imbricata]
MQGIFRASNIQRGDGILRERGDIINSEVFYNMKRFQLYSERDTKGRTVKADINVLQDICKIRRNVEINCQKVLQGNENEINKCNEIKNKLRSLSYIDKRSAKTISCDTYKTDSGFIMRSLSKEENDFPTAFSILMYKDIVQFEILLREIYRPQNVYCIHVDLKAKSAVFNRVANHTRLENAGDIPMGARPLKSCTHISASRAFVNYAVHNNTAQQILNWTRTVKVPDEIYFGVLNFSPHLEAPGAF